MSVTSVGDLVWASISGHPWWPGQVMDSARVPPKMHASAKPNTILVSFLGDNTYNRLKPDCLKPFKGPHFEELSLQKSKNKAFRRAVQEALELQARRAGDAPATDHCPEDFLHPRAAGPGSESNEPEAPPSDAKVDLRPPPAYEADARCISAQRAVAWLRAAAQADAQALAKFSEAEVQAAQRMVFSAAVAHLVPRPHPKPKPKRKAPASGSPSPGPEALRPAKRAKAGGGVGKSGSAGVRPSAAAGGGGGGGAAPKASAAARGDAGLGPQLTPGSSPAAEGSGAGDVQPTLEQEGGDRHASQAQPDGEDGEAQPGKAAGGGKRRRREGDAGPGQESTAAMVTSDGWRLERRMQPSGQSPVIYIPPDGSRQLRSRKQVAAYCEERGLTMPDLTALPAMPGGKPKQAPPPLQPGPVPARVQPAGPAPDQAPLASSAAAGAPGSAPARDAGTAAARIEGEGSLRPEPGHGTGSAVIAAGRGADGGPASNGGGPHAGVPAPHAGSNVRAGQQRPASPAGVAANGRPQAARAPAQVATTKVQGAKPLRPALKSGSATTPAQVPQPPGPHRRVVLRFPKGFPLPSAAQVAARLRRFAARLSAEDVLPNSKAYVVAALFPDEASAAAAAAHLKGAADAMFTAAKDHRPAAAAAVPAARAGPVPGPPGGNRQTFPPASPAHANPEQGWASAVGNPRLAIPHEAASAPAAFAVVSGRPLWVPHNPAPSGPHSLPQTLPQALQPSDLVATAAPAPSSGPVASAASAPPQTLDPVLPGLDPVDLVSILRNAGVQPSAAANPATYPAGVASGPSSGGLAGHASTGSKPAAWAKGSGAPGTRANPDLLPPELRELLGQLGRK